MATPGYVESLIGNLPTEHRAAWKRVMDYVLRNLRFGPVVHQTRAENFQAYYLTGTTPATANVAFSIAHGLGRAPYLLVPVLDVGSVNSQVVPLMVTQAADAQRIYLSSPSTSAAFAMMVE
jgi:hypothetical protein